MMQIGHHAHTLSPGAGLAVFAGYTAAALAAAAALLVKRDVKSRNGKSHTRQWRAGKIL